MICTLTLNPAVDYIMKAPALVPGETNRAASCRLAAGGKGINVSLMLHRLGSPTIPLGVCAGMTGTFLLRELEREGLAPDFVLTDPEDASGVRTRINVKLTAEDGTALEVNAPGAPLPEDALDTLVEKLIGRLRPGDTLALCGSLPSGSPDDTYARLLARLSAAGNGLRDVRLAADTTGDRLLAALPYRPFVIKPNLSELKALTGSACDAADDCMTAAAARTLQKAGARNVLVSLGAQGALLVPEEGPALRIGALSRPADLPAGDPTGAGDSMLAGFLYAVDRGMTLPDALRFATVCGAATAFTADGVARAEDVARLEPAGRELRVTAVDV